MRTLIPDPLPTEVQPTAALAVEVLSARDSAWDKLEFYAAHSVRELVVIDSDARTFDWRALDEGGYTPVPTSAVIELRGADLEAQIDWSLGDA